MLHRLHLTVGIAGVIAFMLTGQYMHWALAHLHGMPDGPRLMFRSSHIYVLWSALLNLAIGCHMPFRAVAGALSPSIRRAQAIGAAAVLLGPALLCWSFLFESADPALSRSACRLAIYLAAFGVALQALAAWAGNRRQD